MIKWGSESANCHCVKAPYDPPYLPLCPILIPSYHPERVLFETFFMHSRYCIVSKLKFTTFQKFLRKYKNCIFKMSFKILPLGVYLKHLNICLNSFGFLRICLNLIAQKYFCQSFRRYIEYREIIGILLKYYKI